MNSVSNTTLPKTSIEDAVISLPTSVPSKPKVFPSMKVQTSTHPYVFEFFFFFARQQYMEMKKPVFIENTENDRKAE